MSKYRLNAKAVFHNVDLTIQRWKGFGDIQSFTLNSADDKKIKYWFLCPSLIYMYVFFGVNVSLIWYSAIYVEEKTFDITGVVISQWFKGEKVS